MLSFREQPVSDDSWCEDTRTWLLWLNLGQLWGAFSAIELHIGGLRLRHQLVGQLFLLPHTAFLIYLQESVLINLHATSHLKVWFPRTQYKAGDSFPKDSSIVDFSKWISLCISEAQGARAAAGGETAVRLRPWQLERFISETMQYNFIEDYSIWRLTDGSETKFGTLIQQRNSADVTSTWAVCSSVGFLRVWVVFFFLSLPQTAIEPRELIQPCSHSKAICCSN